MLVFFFRLTISRDTLTYVKFIGKNEEQKNDTKTIKFFDVCLTVDVCCEGVGSWMNCP